MSRFRLLSLVLLLALPLAGCAPAAADPNVAAVVNGVEIPLSEVEERLETIRANPQAAQQLENDPDGAILRQAENEVLNSLIRAELLEQGAAEELDIEVTDADVDAQREAVIEQIGGQEAFDQVVEQQGLTEEQVDAELRRLALTEAVGARFAEDTEVSDADVESYYEENREAQFGPTATARHILVADAAAAQSVIDRLAAGEDFAAVASEVSTDPGSAAQGGELGELRPGGTVPPFDEAVFNSPVGEVVGPVQTEFGFHIIEVTDRTEGQELSEVEGDIREQLATSGSEQQVNDFLTEQATAAEVTVNPRFGEWNAETGQVDPVAPLGDAETPLPEASGAAEGPAAESPAAAPSE